VTDEQPKQRWLPGIRSGERITAIAMTEPGIGSDLASMTTTASRDGDVYLVNGSKTFITNGINADLVITAVKTDPSQKHKGMSLMVIERGMEGFERGRNLDKSALHSQDTAELFFTDVRVPVENLLGAEGEGFRYLVTNLPQERLSIAVAGLAIARAAYRWTLEYVKERRAFGQSVAAFQNTRFKLAEMATEIAVAEAFVDKAILAHNAGQLTAEEAAMAKWWCTELQGRITDIGVQLGNVAPGHQAGQLGVATDEGGAGGGLIVGRDQPVEDDPGQPGRVQLVVVPHTSVIGVPDGRLEPVSEKCRRRAAATARCA